MCPAADLLVASNQFNLPWQVVAGVMIFTCALIITTRRRASRATSPRGSARRQRELADRRRGREEELREIMIQLETLAREVTAQIDTRYHKLEAVIRDADRRIAELRALANSAGEAPGGLDVTVDDVVVDDGKAAMAGGRTDVLSPGGRIDRVAVWRLADEGHGPDEIARMLAQPIGEVRLILDVRQRRAAGTR